MKHSININGRRTSISLEDEFWDALNEIAYSQRVSKTRLIDDIAKHGDANLASAIRVFVLRHFRGTNRAALVAQTEELLR